MATDHKDSSYRIFAWAALMAGFVAIVVAYRSNRALESNLGMIDLSAITERRDVSFPFTVNVYGYDYSGRTGNVVDEQVLLFGLYEKDRLYFMRDWLKNAAIPNAVAIDGGANTGNHTLYLSRLVSKVHSFEPYPPVIALLRHNLEINPSIRNVEVHEVGLGDREAELTFVHGPDEEMGGGSFRTERENLGGYTRGEQKLKIVAADVELRGETGPIALVKLDVEGFEESVLKGMRDILEKNRPLAVVEVGDQPEGTIENIEQLRALFPKDYDFYAFDNLIDSAIDGRYRLLPLTPEVFNSPLRTKLDVVACPHEREASMPL